MNASEGARRVSIAIRWIGFVLGLVMVAFATQASAWSDAGAILLFAGIIVGGSQLLAWIIDGFAAPRN